MKFAYTLFFGLSFWHADALACSCAPFDHNVEESLKAAQKVFVGIPVKTKLINNSNDPFKRRYATVFRTVAQFKGKEKDRIRTEHLEQSSLCGMTFDVKNPKTFLVFAYRDGIKTMVNLCVAGQIGNRQEVNNALLELLDLTE